MNILPRNFYEFDTVQVAKNLIGKYLVRRIGKELLIGMISECEAYRSDDPASHAFSGKTSRNSSLFGEAGHAYVYISYGLHFCLNAVAYDKKNFEAGGVLIRALIPIKGIKFMENFRHTKKDKLLTNGPGKLTQALDITMKHQGIDLTDPKSDIIICDGPKIDASYIQATTRIGISKGKDSLWRFILDKNFPLSPI
jgi:DNA-3-methyladenine glycosylase